MDLPIELVQAFSIDPAIKDYFDTLPPSHQREYIDHVESAKKPEARMRRAQKVVEQLRLKPKN